MSAGLFGWRQAEKWQRNIKKGIRELSQHHSSNTYPKSSKNFILLSPMPKDLTLCCLDVFWGRMHWEMHADWR